MTKRNFPSFTLLGLNVVWISGDFRFPSDLTEIVFISLDPGIPSRCSKYATWKELILICEPCFYAMERNAFVFTFPRKSTKKANKLIFLHTSTQFQRLNQVLSVVVARLNNTALKIYLAIAV